RILIRNLADPRGRRPRPAMFAVAGKRRSLSRFSNQKRIWHVALGRSVQWAPSNYAVCTRGILLRALRAAERSDRRCSWRETCLVQLHAFKAASLPPARCRGTRAEGIPARRVVSQA